MLDKSRFALNRIIYPKAKLEDFFQLASDLGLHKVELRNDLEDPHDLTDRGIIDDYEPEQVRELLEDYSLKVLTINALQKFNFASLLSKLTEELKELIALARSIKCEAIVLCPSNDPNDRRDEDRIFSETITALKTFGPLFIDSGLLGYVEPLGFPESSLNSIAAVRKMIQEAGFSIYKIVHDTFHHYIGPDTSSTLKNDYDISYTGLVHISGVEEPKSAAGYRDDQRVIVTYRDRLNSREQIGLLLSLGYQGDISFEPFSREVQNLRPGELKAALEASINYICGP